MKRLDFLKLLLGTGLVAAIPKIASPATKKTKLMSCHIAGFPYYDGPKLLPALKSGVPLSLVREPENPYDSYAIALHYRGRKIGFVPRVRNRMLARVMDEGLMEVTSEITDNDNSYDFPGIRVTIFSKK
jgi:hypothetical protein